MALAEINPPERHDGWPVAPLLARDIVLGRLPPEAQEDRVDLTTWQLNGSQETAIRTPTGPKKRSKHVKIGEHQVETR